MDNCTSCNKPNFISSCQFCKKKGFCKKCFDYAFRDTETVQLSPGWCKDVGNKVYATVRVGNLFTIFYGETDTLMCRQCFKKLNFTEFRNRD